MEADGDAARRRPAGPDRNLAMELVRTTEYAALACARWIGRGDKEGPTARRWTPCGCCSTPSPWTASW